MTYFSFITELHVTLTLESTMIYKIIPPVNPKTAAKTRSKAGVVNKVDTNVSKPAIVIPTAVRTSLNIKTHTILFEM